jgi:hypothetical protein
MTRQSTPASIRALRLKDAELVKKLEKGCLKLKGKAGFRNQLVERLSKGIDSTSGCNKLEVLLATKGAFHLNTETSPWKDTDGQRCKFKLARATKTDMWPMGTNYWVRDNAVIGARLLGHEEREKNQMGKALLLSALTFMASVGQLKRFRRIIRSKSAKFVRDANNWPLVFVSIDKNLNASKDESWAHKQDAWQMLAVHILDACEKGALLPRDLTEKHREFLGLIVPFLSKVEFWRSENSGSWEEISAIRCSTIAWEHVLIEKIRVASCNKDFSFFEKFHIREKQYATGARKKESFHGCINRLSGEAATVLAEGMPFESSSYKKTDLRYREADGVLIYLLQLNYPAFLCGLVGANPSLAVGLEKAIVRQVESLFDRATGGFHRYANDTYQRSGFFRFETVKGLEDLYGAPSGDASSYFGEREHIVPAGRMAAWTHLTWQLSAWAGRRYLETKKRSYLSMNRKYFIHGLRLITGKNEISIDQASDGGLRIVSIPEFRMPECYISDRSHRGRDLVFPSPHTPLNWAVAEMTDAFSVRKEVLASGKK